VSVIDDGKYIVAVRLRGPTNAFFKGYTATQTLTTYFFKFFFFFQVIKKCNYLRVFLFVFFFFLD